MEPKIICVDEDDNVIGYETRDNVDAKGLRYRVSALWITNSKGDVLLARRALTESHHPGRWGPAAAGTVDEGETYAENMVKEAWEELGLKDVVLEKGPKIKCDGKHKFFTQWFTCTLDKPLTFFKFQKEEVDQIEWFSPVELKKEMDENPKDFLDNMERYLELFGD